MIHKELYKTFIDKAPFGVLIIQKLNGSKDCRSDFLMLEFNNRFLEIFSIKAEDIIGKKANQLSEISNKLLCDFLNKVIDKSSWNKNNELELFCEELGKWLIIQEIHIGNDFYSYLIEDITERKEAENKFLMTQFAMDYAADSIVWVDENATIVYVNDAMSKSLGYDSAELIGKKIFEIAPDFSVNNVENHKAELKREGRLVFESRLIKKDSSIIPVEISTNYTNFEGSFRACAFIRDITERKNAENALKASEEQYKKLFQTVPDIIIMTDINGIITYINNSRFSSLPDLKTENIIGTNIFSYIAPKDQAKALQNFELMFDRPLGVQEYQLLFENGKVIDTEVNGDVTWDSSNKPIGMVYVIRDVTKKIEIERALIDSEKLIIKEQKFNQLLLDTSPAFIAATDAEGKIIKMNKALLDILEYTPEEVLGLDFVKTFVAEDEQSRIMSLVSQDKTDNVTFSYENSIVSKSGKKILVQWCGKRVIDSDDNSIFVGIGIDITQQEKAQRALIESEERFRSIFQNASIGLYRTTPDGRILMANPTIVKILGYSSFEELSDVNLENSGYAIQAQRKEFKKLLIEKGEIKNFNSAWKRIDGSVVYIRESAKAFFNEDGSVKYYEGTVEDITEQKIAEQQLRESEERFRNMTDLLPQTVFETDLNGNLTFVNQSAYVTFGYDEIDFLKGLNCFDMIIPEDREKARAEFTKNITENLSSAKEYNLLRKDGTTFAAIVFSNAIIKKGTACGLRGIVIDISDRKLAEDEIRRMNEDLEIIVEERTYELNEAIHIIEESNIELKILNESIAKEAEKLLRLNTKLAESESELKIANQTKDKFFSIIAHDLKNPIGSIRNLLELIVLHGKSLETEEIDKLINTAYKASINTFELLENLMEWARIQRGKIDFKPVFLSIKPILEKSLSVTKSIAESKSIAIKHSIPDDMQAYCDRDFLNTIFRNLITNAIKFSKNNSQIMISASQGKEIDEKYDGYYVFSIKDFGVGMSKTIVENLFQLDRVQSMPGTSGERGTGLGLVLCKEFIELHGGEIWVESEEGIGSTFYFTIPFEKSKE
jgi:PAS domain S-box-containing protein